MNRWRKPALAGVGDGDEPVGPRIRRDLAAQPPRVWHMVPVLF